MTGRKALVALCSLVAAAQLCYAGAEATVKADGFAKAVSRLEEAEARAFFEALARTGEEFTFPFVAKGADVRDEDLWLEVDGERVPVEGSHMRAFLALFAEGRATLTPREEPATKRTISQEDPAAKPRGKSKGKSEEEAAEGEAPGPTYRLSGRYGDETFCAADRGDVYPDYEVAGVVDKLQFKNFPYNRDGDAQKLFRECEKEIQGLMSSASGRKNVLRTYAYYELKGETWRTDLLGEVLAHYELGSIEKE